MQSGSFQQKWEVGCRGRVLLHTTWFHSVLALSLWWLVPVRFHGAPSNKHFKLSDLTKDESIKSRAAVNFFFLKIILWISEFYDFWKLFECITKCNWNNIFLFSNLLLKFYLTLLFSFIEFYLFEMSPSQSNYKTISKL